MSASSSSSSSSSSTTTSSSISLRRDRATRIAFVGCGYVADLYVQILPVHADLALVGAWDRDPARLAAFTACHNVRAYADYDALLADPAVDLVVNLTNPRSHHAVSRRALEAGKPVYSEKPLGMTLAEARDLVDLAEARGLPLAAAPCNHLSEAVETLAGLIAEGRLGRPLLVQAEMDDGMVPALDYGSWRSVSGAPWPARDEFEVGCIMEHAGYQIAPLVRLFGPVRRVTALAATCLPDKGAALGAERAAPDVGIGLLEFDGGVVCRLSNSLVAPIDRSLRVSGERAIATIHDVWEYGAPVRLSPVGASLPIKVVRKGEKLLSRWVPGVVLGRPARPGSGAGGLGGRFGKLVRPRGGGHAMDFARGIARLGAALRGEGDGAGVPAALALHVTEVTLALQEAAPDPRVQEMETAALVDFRPVWTPGG